MNLTTDNFQFATTTAPPTTTLSANSEPTLLIVAIAACAVAFLFCIVSMFVFVRRCRNRASDASTSKLTPTVHAMDESDDDESDAAPVKPQRNGALACLVCVVWVVASTTCAVACTHRNNSTTDDHQRQETKTQKIEQAVSALFRPPLNHRPPHDRGVRQNMEEVGVYAGSYCVCGVAKPFFLKNNRSTFVTETPESVTTLSATSTDYTKPPAPVTDYSKPPAPVLATSNVVETDDSYEPGELRATPYSCAQTPWAVPVQVRESVSHYDNVQDTLHM